MAQPTCKQRIREHLNGRLADLRAYMRDPDGDEERGPFNEYGLGFDYVAPGTFKGQRRGYFRYQLSYGGPSDEFRFYCDERRQPVKIEYWFLDWFDGAHTTLTPGSARWQVLAWVWEYFDDCDIPRIEYDRAMAS